MGPGRFPERVVVKPRRANGFVVRPCLSAGEQDGCGARKWCAAARRLGSGPSAGRSVSGPRRGREGPDPRVRGALDRSLAQAAQEHVICRRAAAQRDADPRISTTAHHGGHRRIGAQRELELPEGTSLHTFRHSAATSLLEDGAHIKLVSAILGHSDTAITAEIYGHAPNDPQRFHTKLTAHPAQQALSCRGLPVSWSTPSIHRRSTPHHTEPGRHEWPFAGAHDDRERRHHNVSWGAPKLAAPTVVRVHKNQSVTLRHFEAFWQPGGNIHPRSGTPHFIDH